MTNQLHNRHVRQSRGEMQMLERNFEYIKLIADCQKRGRTAEAAQYSAKLHQNLATMARVADAELPSDINQVLVCVFG